DRYLSCVIKIVLHATLKCYVCSGEWNFGIINDRFVQSRFVHFRNSINQRLMISSQMLFGCLPGVFTGVLYYGPIFLVGELCSVALKSSLARFFPRGNVQG